MVYTLVTGACFAGFALYNDYKQGKIDYKFIWANGIAGFLAVCIAGFNPFIINLYHGRNPLWPALGGGEGDNFIVRFLLFSQEFADKNRFVKLFYSCFSECNSNQGELGHTGPSLKIPFSVHKSEISAFFDPYVDIGGLGPLFGGVLILSVVCTLWAVYVFWLQVASSKAGTFFPDEKRASRSAFIPAMLAALLIAFTTLLNSEAWMARLTPQFWLLPIILLFGVLVLPGTSKWPAVAGTAALLLNSLLIGAVVIVNQVLSEAYVSKQARLLKTLPATQVYKLSNNFSTYNRAILEKYNISTVQFVAPGSCGTTVKLLNSRYDLCLNDIPEPQKTQLQALEQVPFMQMLR